MKHLFVLIIILFHFLTVGAQTLINAEGETIIEVPNNFNTDILIERPLGMFVLPTGFTPEQLRKFFESNPQKFLGFKMEEKEVNKARKSDGNLYSTKGQGYRINFHLESTFMGFPDYLGFNFDLCPTVENDGWWVGNYGFFWVPDKTVKKKDIQSVNKSVQLTLEQYKTQDQMLDSRFDSKDTRRYLINGKNVRFDPRSNGFDLDWK